MMVGGIVRSGDYAITVEGIRDIVVYHDCMTCSVPIPITVEKDYDD